MTTLNELLNLVPKTTFNEKARHDFRVSRFPYCPVLDIINRTTKHSTETASKHFYTSIGTAVHEFIQTFLPLVEGTSFKVFGNWTCPIYSRIDTAHTLSPLYTSCFMPSVKQRKKDGYWKVGCKDRLEYAELEFKFHGLSGHCDMILFNTADNSWHILDFKTTNENAILNPSSVSKYTPSKKYLTQIEIYSTLLRLQYKITVDQYHITYIGRNKFDKPNFNFIENKNNWAFYNYPFKFTPAIYNKRLKQLKQAIKGHKVVNKLLENTDLSTTGADIEQLLSLKPCQSVDHYKEAMGCAFFGKEKCQFATKTKCFKPGYLNQQLSNVLKELQT